jgi:BlaI family penicillinase repressor
MNDLAGRISDAELEVMKVLWEARRELPVTVIREKLQERKGWEPTTIKTLVSRLAGKGVISQEKCGVFYYKPLVTEQEYNEWVTNNLVDKVYQGNVKNLIAALVNSDGLTPEDLKELREMFRVEE